MLRDLAVQNYRCFEDFHIDGLEQVNLFVGNNNSGKTSLLEAIYLLANHPDHRIVDVLYSRGEIVEDIYSPKYRIGSRKLVHLESIKHIFYEHKLEKDYRITISSKDTSDNKTNLRLYATKKKLNLEKQVNITVDNIKDIKEFSLFLNENETLRLSNNSFTYGISDDNNTFLPNRREVTQQLAILWDNIYLTEKENKVVNALKILTPDIERIGFFLSKRYNIVRLKLKNHEQPIPVSSLGDGMYRLLTIAIALVVSENGVLLIDEIETGLHYEAQTDMWRLILETAKELNVQVFATTHSWDCIAAYQEALSQVEDSSIGKLFRLDSKYGKLRAVEYNAEDLEIATREGIEVR